MGHQALDMFTTLGLSKKVDNSWHNSQGLRAEIPMLKRLNQRLLK
jgi:hypothetical protein